MEIKIKLLLNLVGFIDEEGSDEKISKMMVK
jgi:hypothetical protein